MSRAIESLRDRNPAITGAAIVFEDGRVEPAGFPQGVESARFGAVASSILDICSDAAAELDEEGPTEIVIAGAEGFVVIAFAGPGRYLVCTASSDARVADVLLDMKRSIGQQYCASPDEQVSG
ncbi:MAG: roadblock/LC7 domain-containing protein [Coriobacteriia bacterium]